MTRSSVRITGPGTCEPEAVSGPHPVAVVAAQEEPPEVELVGVGVGPGDPSLITVAAVEVLRRADLVIVPVTSPPGGDVGAGPAGRAELVVRAHLGHDRMVRVAFVMSDRSGVTPQRAGAWEAAAQVVLDAFDGGGTTVAFATLGDPNVYSTFTYLAETIGAARPAVRVRTIPGITAMQDLAARAGVVLCEGRETLTLVPATAGAEALEAALNGDGTVVAYKGGRFADQMMETLRRTDRLDGAVVGVRLGTDGERVAPAAAWTRQAGRPGSIPALPYLTTVVSPARRERRGSKL
jgi:precorrin-2/cobalt-factor-2 C20-methyltransferase